MADYQDLIVPFDNFDMPNTTDSEEYVPARRRRRMRRRRRQETRPRLIRRRINYFEMLSDTQFFMRFRLQKATVQGLLTRIEDEIASPTERNHAISPMNRLLLTLRFLATGSFFICAGDFIGVSKTAAHVIIIRVVKAIGRLRRIYIKMPHTQRERDYVRTLFHDKARFPRVLGAIDCTHIKVMFPGGDDGNSYLNRKGYYSKNVQVISGPNLEIFDIVTRWPGKYHDMTIFNSSRVCYELETSAMYGTDFLIGDAGYECRRYLLTPLSNPQTRAEKLYNESFIRTRTTVERLFGVWKRRFPILSIGIRVKSNHPERIDEYIMACAVLHNIAVQEREPEPLIDPNFDVEEPEQPEPGPIPADAQAGGTLRSRLFVRDQIISTHFTNLRSLR